MAVPLLELLATMSTVSFAQAPDLASEDVWRPGSLPFSFVYHGQKSDPLLIKIGPPGNLTGRIEETAW
jgi:hypothetical protein